MNLLHRFHPAAPATTSELNYMGAHYAHIVAWEERARQARFDARLFNRRGTR